MILGLREPILGQRGLVLYLGEQGLNLRGFIFGLPETRFQTSGLRPWAGECIEGRKEGRKEERKKGRTDIKKRQ